AGPQPRPPIPPPQRRPSKWIAAGVLVAVSLAGAGFVFRDRFSSPAVSAPHATVTLLISDFNNHTGDAVFDGTLEPMFKLALEGAGFISAYDRTQLRTLGARLDHPGDKLDEPAARRIALSQGLG